MTDDTTTVDPVDSIVDAEIAETATETTDKTDKPEGEQAAPKTYTEDDVKKYERDLDRERRRIGKITAQKYQFKSEADQLRAQIAELQKKVPQTDGKPDIRNYDGRPGNDYEQYQIDLINHVNKQNEQKPQQQTTQEDYQKAIWRQQRAPALVSQVQAASQTFPDIQQKMQANVQLLDSLPSHVADAFFEADHGALAIYQLLEDGMIPHLAGMSPDSVTALIESAEDKALARQKPATKAPTPMASAKGTAPGSASLETMSPDQLRKWMAS